MPYLHLINMPENCLEDSPYNDCRFVMWDKRRKGCGDIEKRAYCMKTGKRCPDEGRLPNCPIIDRDLEGENEKLKKQLGMAKETMKWVSKYYRNFPDEANSLLLKAIREIDELKQEVREC